MKYISIDIETTGLDPEKHQILEFAAVYDDLKNPRPINQMLQFVRKIRWSDYVINDYCLRLHQKLLEEIEDRNDGNVICIDQLGGHFNNWMGLLGIPPNYNVAGKNFAGFDGLFLKKVPYFSPWHYRVIDIGSMYLEKGMNEIPSLSDIVRVASPEHRALPDALAVVQAVRAKLL